MRLVTTKAASLSLILVCYSLDVTQRTCCNFSCPEVVSQLNYMIILCPFQHKILPYSILGFVWTEPHCISKSCAQWRPLHIYTAPAGSAMPLVVLCWVWMWTNVCISALHWPRCPWLQCLCSGRVAELGALDHSTRSFWAEQQRDFPWDLPKEGRITTLSFHCYLCFLDGDGYKDQDISWTISSVGEIIEPKH